MWISNKGGEKVTPTQGRPPIENPRDIQYRLRMTKADAEKLEYCCKQTGKTKAEILREGLDLVYKAIKK